jgi:Transposase DDE domain
VAPSTGLRTAQHGWRGARQPDATQTKLVCVYDHAHQLVLTQAALAGGDEITAFTRVLGTLPDLGGVLVTADALHCQRDHVQFLADRGGSTCSP